MQMRFVCDKCRAKYSISKEKVRKKVLRIRCKKCANVIVVRDPDSEAAKRAAAKQVNKTAVEPAKTIQQKPNGHGGGGGLQPQGFSPKPAQRSGHIDVNDSFGAPAPSERTVVARISADWFRKREEATGEKPTWFMAINGQPLGPVVLQEVLQRVRAGELTPQSLVWRDGWRDWVAAYTVSELKGSFFNQQPQITQATAPPTVEDQREIDDALGFLGGTTERTRPGKAATIAEPQRQQPQQIQQPRAFEPTEPEKPAGFGGFFQQKSEPAKPVGGGDPFARFGNESVQQPLAAAPVAEPAPKPTSGGFSSQSGLQSTQAPQKMDNPLGGFPIPEAPTSSSALPTPGVPGQDIAHEAQAMPAQMQAAPAPPAQVQFFEVPTASHDDLEAGFFADENKFFDGENQDEELISVALPPIPIMEEEEELEVDAEDILAMESMKSKWTARFAIMGVFGVVGAAAFLIMFGERIGIKMPGTKSKFKIGKNSGKSGLSKSQQSKANALLLGNGEDAGRIRQEKKRKRKVYRRRSSVASNTPFRERPVKVRKASKEDLFANDLLNRVGARLGRKGLPRPKPGAKKDPQYELKLKLSKAINRKNASVKYCYEQYLKQVTKGGRMDLRLTIQPDGSVSNVYVIRKTFRGGRMKKCILRRIQRWQFRAFGGKPVKLEIPYTFKALF